jgi:hypothetical protein
LSPVGVWIRPTFTKSARGLVFIPVMTLRVFKNSNRHYYA